MSQPPPRSGRPQSNGKGSTARPVATAGRKKQARQAQRAPDGQPVLRGDDEQHLMARSQQPLSEVGDSAGGNDSRASSSGATSTAAASRSSSWWPFETDTDETQFDSRRGQPPNAPSWGWRRGLSDWWDRRDWQRLADVLLVGALVVVIGLTAKTVLDQGSAGTDAGTAEEPSGGDRNGGVAGALTAGDPGSLVTSRVTASGTLVVKQKLVTSSATSNLILSNGQTSPAAEGEDDTVVRDLTVAVDGRQVEPPQTTLEEGESAEVVLDDSASEFLLDYVVEGAVTASDASASGRAVVELTSLGADASSGPKVVRIRAGETGEVLSVACGPSLAVAEPCGQPGDEGWSVRLSGTETDTGVFASVDLPTG